MDIRSLRAFEALASTLHFGRAAAQCNVSASTLSRMVRRLEHELGCRLFDRSSRSVRPRSNRTAPRRKLSERLHTRMTTVSSLTTSLFE
jgi:DNA-binding transcriptional LysR family regulator